MTLKLKHFLPFLFLLITFCKEKSVDENNFVIYQVNPKKQNIGFYWKNESNQIFRSIGNLEKYINSKNQKLIFAMNGGMFEVDSSPKGLYIENFKILKPIDTLDGNGNFYLKPNGIFLIKKNGNPQIIETSKFKMNEEVRFATQSGPILLENEKINPIFQENSKNLNIRNGVGILENGDIVFAMSKSEINFYNFAKLFQNMKCKNALYLDGFVSRTFLPEKKWNQKDGNFGVIIGVTE